MKFGVAFSLLVGPAWATCDGYEVTFLSCQIEKTAKSLSVWFDDDVASYRLSPTMGAQSWNSTRQSRVSTIFLGLLQAARFGKSPCFAIRTTPTLWLSLPCGILMEVPKRKL